VLGQDLTLSSFLNMLLRAGWAEFLAPALVKNGQPLPCQPSSFEHSRNTFWKLYYNHSCLLLKLSSSRHCCSHGCFKQLLSDLSAITTLVNSISQFYPLQMESTFTSSPAGDLWLVQTQPFICPDCCDWGRHPGHPPCWLLGSLFQLGDFFTQTAMSTQWTTMQH
jgi:hypothetical protein